ncbi:MULTISPECIES: helix-turn-helix transcriptional regulator [Enterococcus]|uniref:helix-turn-helix transcriptional regulator n=1 Tax=Enterococcus TaxID=1350 RepID=UPI001782C6DA|nr:MULTISPECIES: helix-turn-helix transcriptional regulator [Enterococcus]MBD9863840.1 helix-turn-helix transcriptional regulator [Enterococcus faecalis]MBD9897040.1 helix-turn-helix transcriptional regulator [Enterococcus faecalis]MCE2536864.1 helix-turn-helix domain-containing protein [Enterococcus faecalis]MDQ8643237.1 helix-turn-helix transcriptional regulator [Enterococcus sp. FR192]HAP2843021.1 helix-turn-helix transcriptional regulator [Enterococcus faecalis]
MKKVKIYDLRREKRMTQKELAKKTGITERTIINYENSIDALRNAKYSTVEKIATALGVTVDDIFLTSISEKPKSA